MVKWDRNGRVATEVLNQGSSSTGFNLSGGAKGATGSFGFTRSSSHKNFAKFKNYVVARGFRLVHPGQNSCFDPKWNAH